MRVSQLQTTDSPSPIHREYFAARYPRSRAPSSYLTLYRHRFPSSVRIYVGELFVRENVTIFTNESRHISPELKDIVRVFLVAGRSRYPVSQRRAV